MYFHISSWNNQYNIKSVINIVRYIYIMDI